jgi:hypothetical protein
MLTGETRRWNKKLNKKLRGENITLHTQKLWIIMPDNRRWTVHSKKLYRTPLSPRGLRRRKD